MGKSTLARVFGRIFFLLSFIGLVAGILEYPIWSRNNEVLQRNEAIGHFSQEDRDLVRFQFSIMAVSFGSFILFLVLALYLLWVSQTDRLIQILSRQQSSLSPQSILPAQSKLMIFTIIIGLSVIGFILFKNPMIILFGIIVGVILYMVMIGSTMRIHDSLSPLLKEEETPTIEDDDLIIVDEESADVCPRCRQLIDKSWKRCPNCLLPLKINCPECNEEINASWKACPYCGKILKKKTIIKKEALRD